MKDWKDIAAGLIVAVIAVIIVCLPEIILGLFILIGVYAYRHC